MSRKRQIASCAARRSSFGPFAMLIAVAALVAASGCGAGASLPPQSSAVSTLAAARGSPRMVKAFDQPIPWLPADGVDSGRMIVADPEQFALGPIYTALWDRHRSPVLVALQQVPQDLFGANWDVEVYSADGARVAKGTFRCWQYDQPYCLVEVRSTATALPPKYRDRWILAVAMWNPKSPVDPAAPLRFDGGPPVNDGRDDDGVNVMSLEPIRWGDDDQDQFVNVGVGALYRPEEPGRQVRSAEAAFELRVASPGRPTSAPTARTP